MRVLLPGTVSLAVRVAAGTALFMLVLVAVQSRDARIAGMMLTFPALNGISLMMAPATDKRAMARAMLAVIALNGILGLGFIEVMGVLSGRLGAGAVHWVWPLSAAAFVGWLAVCWVLSRTAPGGERLVFWGFVTATPALIALWWVVCPLIRDVPSGGVVMLVATHADRIGLFALTLGLLLAAAQWLGATDTLIGRLGAFPLLPLFSLATIAETEAAGHGSLDRLMAVRPAMLLGLLLAMAFAWIYSGYLMWLQRCCPVAASRWWIGALSGLIGGWIVCAGVTFASMVMVSWVEGCG